MKLILNIEIDYSPNNVPEEVLRALLVRAATHLAAAGFLTGETEAEVEQWNYEVRRLDTVCRLNATESLRESLREIIAKWKCQYCNNGRKLVYADGDRERYAPCTQCGGTRVHEHARELELAFNLKSHDAGNIGQP